LCKNGKETAQKEKQHTKTAQRHEIHKIGNKKYKTKGTNIKRTLGKTEVE
jgi:prophage antirepressor-like protein